MDILDILIAKKKSFTGETEKLVKQAKQAMADANDVIERVDAIEDAAEAAAASASSAAEEWEEMRADITSAAASVLEEKIAEHEIPTEAIENLEIVDSNVSSFKSRVLNFWKKGQQSAATIIKNYTSTGQNEDGGMTQKAITNALQTVTPNLGSGNSGKMVKVSADGSLTCSTLTEQQIIDGISDTPSPEPISPSRTVGIVIDYENKTVTRCEDSTNLNAGSDFDQFTMFGGRKRCNVNANGLITAWYGDDNYRDDGSNGDVMVYQPKFSYKRTIDKYSNGPQGKIVRKETLLLTDISRNGFKVHPRFKDASGNTIDYILLPAYEASAYDVSNTSFLTNDESGVDFDNDYLVSRAGSKPITGDNNDLTVLKAEKLASNKGSGWHIIDMGAVSINQMLFMVEYATLNSQSAIASGVSSGSATIATGQTSSLGNGTGENSQYQIRSVSYRGCENIWGNVWKFVGAFAVIGDNVNKFGLPVSGRYPYSTAENFESLQFNVSKQSSWISAMGYENTNYDWVYLPAECSGGNSAVPVGDNFWTITNYTQTSVVAIGGSYTGSSNNGIFYYACDHDFTHKSGTYGAAIMFIPAKNNIYTGNISAWNAKMGG